MAAAITSAFTLFIHTSPLHTWEVLFSFFYVLARIINVQLCLWLIRQLQERGKHVFYWLNWERTASLLH